MRRVMTFMVAGLLALGCAVPAVAADERHGAGSAVTGSVGTQVGTYAYLTQPDYDGLAPVLSSVAGTTLGLGTFDRLDGELVLVGGEVYRVGVDGVPRVVTDAARTTPFLTATRFRAVHSGPVPPGSTCVDLERAVTALAPSAQGMVAVRVRGTFTNLVTRSVPAQTTPYPSLAQVVAGQTTFPLGQRKAVLVGFWTGPAMLGVGAPGLHLHALTADRSAGGHVLSCVAGGDVQISVQPLASVTVVD